MVKKIGDLLRLRQRRQSHLLRHRDLSLEKFSVVRSLIGRGPKIPSSRVSWL
jgi:hypothetical protein